MANQCAMGRYNTMKVSKSVLSRLLSVNLDVSYIEMPYQNKRLIEHKTNVVWGTKC